MRAMDGSAMGNGNGSFAWKGESCKRHRNSPPSSACGAPPLRFGRFAMTAPSRQGEWPPSASMPETGPQGPVHGVEALGNQKGLARAERSSLAAGDRVRGAKRA